MWIIEFSNSNDIGTVYRMEISPKGHKGFRNQAMIQTQVASSEAQLLTGRQEVKFRGTSILYFETRALINEAGLDQE